MRKDPYFRIMNKNTKKLNIDEMELSMGDYMSQANNILKMLIGIVILVIGIVWYTGPQIYGFLMYYQDLLAILRGSIGLLLLFVGLIVAWMGYDDYKMDKEMAKEAKKEPEEKKEEPK